MPQSINKNLTFLCETIRFKERENLQKLYRQQKISFEEHQLLAKHKNIKAGAVLEGSSRSGKTTAVIDFIIYLCANFETNATINIIRETYNSFKTTLYDDFGKRLTDFSIEDNPFKRKQDVQYFKLFGNKINFLGADGDLAKFMGAGADYVYFNEMLDIDKSVTDQAIMRCRKFWIGDFNPKFSDHYVFNTILTQPNVAHLKTTFYDNPFISTSERAKIESYQTISSTHIAKAFVENDTLPAQIAAVQKAKDYNTAKNERKFSVFHIEELKRAIFNEKTGTASEYDWQVYGLGERRAPEGLIFEKVTWVREFPSHIEKIFYGLDFGYTISPSALCKVGISGNDMYLEKLFYQPTPAPDVLIDKLAHYIKDEVIWCDPSGESGGKGMISMCRRAGFKAFPAKTFPGSIKFGLGLMKKYNIHIVESQEFRKEQVGYTRAKVRVNGVMVTTDDPVDGNNHLWDAARIAVISSINELQ